MTMPEIRHHKLYDKKTNVTGCYKIDVLSGKKEKEQNKKISSIGWMAFISRIFVCHLMINQIQALVLSSGVPILY
jgi:hypothetical protein